MTVRLRYGDEMKEADANSASASFKNSLASLTSGRLLLQNQNPQFVLVPFSLG
jgi:hypothetical protein